MAGVRVDGPTPLGGAYAVASFTDAAGAATDDPSQAVATEITEFDSYGNELGRTYGRNDIPGGPGIADDLAVEDEDVDAVKGGKWDVTISVDGIIKHVETLDELRALLESDVLGEALFRSTVASMLVLPVWANAPEGLRTEINDYLIATRPQ